MPDSGFHKSLNECFAPHVAGHEFSQLLLEGLPVRMNRIGLSKVGKGTAGLVIGQARTPFDGLLNRLPRLGKIFEQGFQICLTLLAPFGIESFLLAPLPRESSRRCRLPHPF